MVAGNDSPIPLRLVSAWRYMRAFTSHTISRSPLYHHIFGFAGRDLAAADALLSPMLRKGNPPRILGILLGCIEVNGHTHTAGVASVLPCTVSMNQRTNHFW
jgi:hypothetical protein